MELKGFSNYLIYEDGRIWSRCKEGEWKKFHSDKDGYLQVNLHENGKRTLGKLHRLLALQFIPNPNNHPVVDHIDRDKTNNNLTNLRWVSLKGNSQNVGIRRNNLSGVNGVGWRKERSCWVAKIQIDGKTKQKNFKEKEDAINWRREKEEEYYLS